MIARLRAEVSLAEAQAQIDTLNERMLKGDPMAKTMVAVGFHTLVHDLQSDHVAALRPVLLLLQAIIVRRFGTSAQATFLGRGTAKQVKLPFSIRMKYGSSPMKKRISQYQKRAANRNSGSRFRRSRIMSTGRTRPTVVSLFKVLPQL